MVAWLTIDKDTCWWPWVYCYWNVCFWNCYLSGIPYLWLLIFMVVTWDADLGNCVISLVTWTKLDGASLCSVMKKGRNTSTNIDGHDYFICEYGSSKCQNFLWMLQICRFLVPFEWWEKHSSFIWACIKLTTTRGICWGFHSHFYNIV